MVGEADRLAATSWHRTLVGVVVAISAGIFGGAFVNPFTPLFLVRDLGVKDSHQLALWTGLILSSTSMTKFVAGPFWGSLADRRGRKSMLIRAQIASGTTIAIMGLAQNPPELLALRLLMGIASGVSIAAMALVVSEAPRARLGWAVGLTSSAQATALSLSPLAAGILATVLPLRIVFVIGGALMICSTIPVILLVKESARADRSMRNDSIRHAMREVAADARAAIVILLASQVLIYLAYSGGQQLILLRIISLNPDKSSVPIGITVGAMGLAAGLAAALSYRLVPRFGFRRLGIAAGLLAGTMLGAAAVVPSTTAVAISASVAGIAFGVGWPALQSMLGLEAPGRIKSTLFGAMGSATSLGQATGYLSAGLVATAIGTQRAMSVSVVAAFAIAILLFVRGREPIQAVTMRATHLSHSS